MKAVKARANVLLSKDDTISIEFILRHAAPIYAQFTIKEASDYFDLLHTGRKVIFPFSDRVTTRYLTLVNVEEFKQKLLDAIVVCVRNSKSKVIYI